jgi:hypothetical protein
MAAPAVQTSSLRKKIAPCKRGPVAEKIEERSGVSERFPLERLGLPGWLRRFLEGRVDLCITGDRIGLGGGVVLVEFVGLDGRGGHPTWISESGPGLNSTQTKL